MLGLHTQPPIHPKPAKIEASVNALGYKTIKSSVMTNESLAKRKKEKLQIQKKQRTEIISTIP